MKIYPTLLMAALLLASCGGKEQNVSETAEGQQTASADTTSASTAQQDSVTVDAVSSATNVANSPTFNGVLIASPTQMATVISVDQAVDKTDYSIKAYAKVKDHNAMFRPGMYVRARMRQ